MAAPHEEDAAAAPPEGPPVSVPEGAGTSAELQELPAVPEPSAATVACGNAPQRGAEPPPEDVSSEGWQPVKPKRRGRPPGSKNKPKIVALPPELQQPLPDVEEEEEDQPEPLPARAPPRPARRRAELPDEACLRQPVYYAPAPPTFGHRDLGSILSEHLLQVETQKRLSQQEMYARLVRGVL